MKLLYACWLNLATTDFPLFAAQCWERRGHSVRLYPFDLEFSNLAEASIVDRLATQNVALRQNLFFRRLDRVCQQFQPDSLLFAYPFVSPAQMRQLRDRHGAKIGFSLGYNNLLEHQIAESLATADYLLVHDSYMFPLLRGGEGEQGRCPPLFPMPATFNPLEHRPLALSDWDRRQYGGDVAFIGGYSPSRAAALGALTRYELKIWGYPTWKRAPELAPWCSAEPVYGLKKTKIYNACKIVISLEDPAKNINSINGRVAEVLACGGFVLANSSKDLDATGLKDGESVATFDSPAEMAEKVAFYLSHPEELRRVSAAGQRIVLDTLYYDKSYGGLLDEVAASLGLPPGDSSQTPPAPASTPLLPPRPHSPKNS